jgi:hypothetical protein
MLARIGRANSLIFIVLYYCLVGQLRVEFNVRLRSGKVFGSYSKIIRKTSTFLLTSLSDTDSISPCVLRTEMQKAPDRQENRTEFCVRLLYERSDFKHLENWIL